MITLQDYVKRYNEIFSGKKENVQTELHRLNEESVILEDGAGIVILKSNNGKKNIAYLIKSKQELINVVKKFYDTVDNNVEYEILSKLNKNISLDDSIIRKEIKNVCNKTKGKAELRTPTPKNKVLVPKITTKPKAKLLSPKLNLSMPEISIKPKVKLFTPEPKKSSMLEINTKQKMNLTVIESTKEHNLFQLESTNSTKEKKNETENKNIFDTSEISSVKSRSETSYQGEIDLSLLNIDNKSLNHGSDEINEIKYIKKNIEGVIDRSKKFNCNLNNLESKLKKGILANSGLTYNEFIDKLDESGIAQYIDIDSNGDLRILLFHKNVKLNSGVTIESYVSLTPKSVQKDPFTLILGDKSFYVVKRDENNVELGKQMLNSTNLRYIGDKIELSDAEHVMNIKNRMRKFFNGNIRYIFGDMLLENENEENYNLRQGKRKFGNYSRDFPQYNLNEINSWDGIALDMMIEKNTGGKFFLNEFGELCLLISESSSNSDYTPTKIYQYYDPLLGYVHKGGKIEPVGQLITESLVVNCYGDIVKHEFTTEMKNYPRNNRLETMGPEKIFDTTELRNKLNSFNEKVEKENKETCNNEPLLCMLRCMQSKTSFEKNKELEKLLISGLKITMKKYKGLITSNPKLFIKILSDKHFFMDDLYNLLNNNNCDAFIQYYNNNKLTPEIRDALLELNYIGMQLLCHSAFNKDNDFFIDVANKLSNNAKKNIFELLVEANEVWRYEEQVLKIIDGKMIGNVINSYGNDDTNIKRDINDRDKDKDVSEAVDYIKIIENLKSETEVLNICKYVEKLNDAYGVENFNNMVKNLADGSVKDELLKIVALNEQIKLIKEYDKSYDNILQAIGFKIVNRLYTAKAFLDNIKNNDSTTFLYDKVKSDNRSIRKKISVESLNTNETKKPCTVQGKNGFEYKGVNGFNEKNLSKNGRRK